jgi:Family of unknown function (DUF5695)
MKLRTVSPGAVFVLLALAVYESWFSLRGSAQNQQPALPSTLNLDQGYLDLESPDFVVKLVKASQTVAALRPRNTASLDFTPGDRLERRAANGYHHLGDLILRLRAVSSGPWQQYDTALSRKPVQPLPVTEPTLAAADLSPTLPADTPVRITRSWLVERGRLVLRFELKNTTTQPVQLGADDEWRGIEPWNQPTFATLAPGATKTYGVRLLLADEIRQIEASLAADSRPVAIGIPGYILPMDIDGRLFLKHNQNVARLAVYPEGALEVRADRVVNNAWQAFTIRGKKWGRARLSVSFDDGSTQTISYYITKPSTEAVADLGRFLFTRQWFDDATDPFHRGPSIMSYDRETNKILTQDSRVWIAGLGDEGGSGSWLAAAMKEFGQPRKEEVRKFEQFVDGVLWGRLQYNDGPNKYGVRKSLFYYSPIDLPDYKYDPTLDWTTWTSWKKTDAESIGRGYNYPHVVAAYWSMYRLARNHTGLVTNHPWDWYLDQAYETVKFMFSRTPNGRRRVGYVELGLMEGDIILAVLEDLKREGWNEKATVVEALMKERAERWKQEAFPFGSEMAWDSTGQEEVYAWCKFFGYDDKALVSLNSIIGYMPTLPHWGYNGNARRYWDFLYAGKTRRIERQLHHYGSGLNAIPVLSRYRDNPADDYLVRVGYGGAMGALSNIDQEGFASVAFHSFPSTLKWDPYTGDYGPNFFGHALTVGTYLINHADFGWQAFGGNVTRNGEWVNVQPRDSFRKRVFLAPVGLWLVLDAGTFERVSLNTRTNAVRIVLSQSDSFTTQARLRVQQPARIASVRTYTPRTKLLNERDAFTIPLRRTTTSIELSAKP